MDIESVVERLAVLIDEADRDRSGLPTMRQMVELARGSMDLPGAVFVEFGLETGRVIVASGSAEATLGRRVDRSAPLDELLRGGSPVCGSADVLPDDLREVLGPPEGGGFLLALVSSGNQPVGLLAAATPSGTTTASAAQRAVGRLFALTIGRLYRADNALGLHAGRARRVPTDVTAIVDVDGLVSWVNPRAVAVLESGALAVGKPLPLPTPGPGESLEHNTPDGRWLAVTSQRLADGVGHSISIRDITEDRRWERSRELFVALTSHELRTPVTVIKGYADTLNDRFDALDDEGKREAIRILGQRAGDLARLLDRLLSAVGQPGVPPAVSRFDLAEAVGEALDTMPEDVRGRLDLDLGDDVPTAFGERASIASVVHELITNAVKYAPPATGPITIRPVIDARTVGLSVADCGVGVRPEHVERAFERFWQADVGDHRRFGGVGLGLYLVRRIVERQHGWVALRPRPDGGTIAEFRLPRGDLRPDGTPLSG